MKHLFAFFVLAVTATTTYPLRSAFAAPKYDETMALDASLIDKLPKDQNLSYDADLAKTQFTLHYPANYTDDQTFGLLVVATHFDVGKLPGWDHVLAQHKLITVTIDHALNPIKSYFGAAVFAAVGIQHKRHIDSNRIYTVGFTGGGKISGSLGFAAPNIFHGVIEMDDLVLGTSTLNLDTPNINPILKSRQLVVMTSENNMKAAKSGVSWALITSKNTPRHELMISSFDQFMTRRGFHTKLIDLPHDDANATLDAATFDQAVSFISGDAMAASPPPSAATTPPAWMSKPLNAWPQILLQNDFRTADKTVEFLGAGAFLTRLDDGRVVGMTARHIFENHPTLAQFDSTPHTWFLASRPNPTIHVLMGKLLLNPTEVGDLDVVVAGAPPTQKSFPVQVLPVRKTLLEVGETVYLIGVPNSEKSRQNIYKGTVIEHRADGFLFEIDGRFITGGLSGSPILDASGNLAAVYTAHLDDQKVPGKLQVIGIEMANILPHIQPAPATLPAP